MYEILGRNVEYVKVQGLLDSFTENEFEEQWAKLENVWSSRVVQVSAFMVCVNSHAKTLGFRYFASGI